jgi:hypothetical protein
MIKQFEAYKARKIDLRGEEKLTLTTLKKLAVKDEIEVIDFELINKIALRIHNYFKRYKVITVNDAYKKWGLVRVKKIQFIFDDSHSYSYYHDYEDGTIQIVVNENKLDTLHHEIQHALYSQKKESHPLAREIWDLSEVMVVLDDVVERSKHGGKHDLYSFFYDIYTLFPDEVEAHISEIYQDMLKLRTTRKSFDRKLKDTKASGYLDIIEKRDYLNKLISSSKYRVDFFSQINNLLENIEESNKIKLKKSIFANLFSREKQKKIKYSKKISQEKADELSHFWISYLSERAYMAMQRVKTMRYLFRK